MKKGDTKGFTLVEIMFVVSIIGLLAAIGIPVIMGAYAKAQETTRSSNIIAVEKAKSILALPSELMQGAMSLQTTDPFDEEAINHLCTVLRISNVSELTVGKTPIVIGDLITKSRY